MNSSLCLLFVWVATSSLLSEAFTSAPSTPSVRPFFALSSSTVEADTDETTSSISNKALFKRDRYIATNRFAVRKGKQAKFEQRWATRKSRLATLPGFRYFHLMRRVVIDDGKGNGNDSCVYDEGDTAGEAEENYVSFTIWDKKSDFSAWRKGDAFIEAHGGKSIGAFLSTMVNSALVLRGPPRPAFYDGLFLKTVRPTSTPLTVDGWRNVEADGIETLPAECFVALEKYYVTEGNALKFEEFWEGQGSNKNNDKHNNGVVAATLLRRDGQAKGHGTVEMADGEANYVAARIFADKEAADQWASAQKELDVSSPPKPLWNKAPNTVYYEGTLVIASEEGA